MLLFPNAKINLGLHILSKREDSYHDLETVMIPVGLRDILEFIPSGSGETNLKVTGLTFDGNKEDNLVYKAYMLLKEQYSLPGLKIHLHKIIPSGAGLGGGSSDAAFMLTGLNRMFGLGISNSELKNFASLLGSDCSVFIENVPQLATGRGEVLTPADNSLKGHYLYLLFPGFSVSTAEAYRGVKPDSGRKTLAEILKAGIHNWKAELVNDFEDHIFRDYPVLARIKEDLYNSGAVYASMSGSGSAVYGLFSEKTVISPEWRKYLIWQGRM
jgi:4-diphosphocytidyl-2-C-methyl-D-erythritol kinase